MPKRAISVTLEAGNLTWLRGRARAGGARSVSEVLDRLVTEARTRGVGGDVRSAVGTIDIDPSDPLLDTADEAIAALFAASPAWPTAAREKRSTYGAHRRGRRG